MTNWLSHPLLPLCLRHRQAQTVWYNTTSHIIDSVKQAKDILNFKRYQNCIIGSKVKAIFLDALILIGVVLGRVCDQGDYQVLLLTDPVKPGLFYKHRRHWIIPWLSHPTFSSKSSKHHKSQTVRARDLTFLHNVHHLTHVMCHMSSVMCQFSCFYTNWWRVCYQRGLARLVFQ